MPTLQTSEVFLIILVISLWIISVLVCIRRYSLFLCFHKRDVPFYNASLIDEKQPPPTPPSNNQNNLVNVNLVNLNTNSSLSTQERPMSPTKIDEFQSKLNSKIVASNTYTPIPSLASNNFNNNTTNIKPVDDSKTHNNYIY